jgi:hypothetical protein
MPTKRTQNSSLPTIGKLQKVTEPLPYNISSDAKTAQHRPQIWISPKETGL